MLDAGARSLLESHGPRVTAVLDALTEVSSSGRHTETRSTFSRRIRRKAKSAHGGVRRHARRAPVTREF